VVDLEALLEGRPSSSSSKVTDAVIEASFGWLLFQIPSPVSSGSSSAFTKHLGNFFKEILPANNLILRALWRFIRGDDFKRESEISRKRSPYRYRGVALTTKSRKSPRSHIVERAGGLRLSSCVCPTTTPMSILV